MEIAEIKNIIVTNLYLRYFELGGECNLVDLGKSFDLESVKYDNLLDQMQKDGLIVPWTMGGNYRIAPYGVLWSEEQSFLPLEHVAQNRHIRTSVLALLADLYETHGAYQTLHIDQLNQTINCDPHALAGNLYVLEEFDYIQFQSYGSSKITSKGLDAVWKWRKNTTIADRLDTIRDLEPHERGRAFQSYFSELVLREGWDTEEGVRTSSEEIDLMIHKGREFFLIECKWEKQPTQARIVRELFGKLSHRIDTKGIIVSMSGFTSGAIEDVRSYANQRVILLFGPKDVEKIGLNDNHFEGLLNEKYKQLITRVEVIFE